MKALYFPNLSLPPLAWTNPVALYFDQIGVIAPIEYEAGLSSPHTARLVEAGLVLPMFGGFSRDADEEDAHVLESIVRSEERGSAQRGRSYKLYRIHAGKLAYTPLVEALVGRQLLQYDRNNRSWLIGPEDICLQVMTVLAQRIVREGNADSIITDEATAMTVASGKTGTTAKVRNRRRLRAVCRLLPVGPWATPQQLSQFKTAHGPELRNFRGFVEALCRRDAEDADFEARVGEAERLRDHLKGELGDLRAGNRILGLSLLVANVVAPLMEGSFFSTVAGGAGLFSAFRTGTLNRRRSIEYRTDSLAYAALAGLTLRASTSNDILV